MTERQPDMLGGKAVPASGLRRMRSRSKAPIRREGWAGTPGAGPEGETCGSCTYCESFHFKKTYHKCGARAGDHWKGGRATDIRPLDPACDKWSPTTERVNIEKAKADASKQPVLADPMGDARGAGKPVSVARDAPGKALRIERAARIDPLQLTLDV